MPSLVLPWWSQEVESRRSRPTLHKTKQEDQLQWALMLMRRRMNILVDYASYRHSLKYLTYLWCWAYPKVPDLPELHCNCDMGMLIWIWQLLGTIQEKKHDCTCHLETSLDFISDLVGASSGPCLQLIGKIWEKFLLKAQFKRNQNPRSTGAGEVVQNFKCWISAVDTFWFKEYVCDLFSELNIPSCIWLFIFCLTPFKADCAREDFSLVQALGGAFSLFSTCFYSTAEYYFNTLFFVSSIHVGVENTKSTSLKLSCKLKSIHTSSSQELYWPEVFGNKCVYSVCNVHLGNGRSGQPFLAMSEACHNQKRNGK